MARITDYGISEWRDKVKLLIGTVIVLVGIAVGTLIIVTGLEVNRMLKERHGWKR